MSARSPLSRYAMTLSELVRAGAGAKIVFFCFSTRRCSDVRVFDAVIGQKVVSHLVEPRRGVDPEAALNLVDVGLVPMGDGVSWHPDVFTVHVENISKLNA